MFSPVKLFVGLLASVLIFSACTRDFAQPEPLPPTVRIVSLWPESGFSGDALALCATFLDDPAGNNRVFFDAVQTTVEGFEAPNDWQAGPQWSCAEKVIWVRVPVLDYEGQVPLVISNTTGQSAADLTFDYRGPGHPVNSQVEKEIGLNAGLWALFTSPNLATALFGGVSHNTSTMSISDSSFGLHLDFGLCDTPMSGAAAVTDFFVLKLMATTMSLASGGTLEPELSMFSWEIDLLDLIESYTFQAPETLPMPSTSDRLPFMPYMVWVYPRAVQPTPGVTVHDVVASHALRPALMFFSPDQPDQAQVVEWPEQDPYCDQNGSSRLGPVVDVVFDQQNRDFYATVAGTNEIWRISADSYQLDRIWPPPITTGYESQIKCDQNYGALALRRSHDDHAQLRLYVAHQSGIQEFRVEGSLQGELAIPTLSRINLDGAPYSMTTGLFHGQSDTGLAQKGERLYALTQNGMTIMDISRTRSATPGIHRWKKIGEIPMPANRGGPQSLIAQDNYAILGAENDTILAADAARDLVHQFRAGEEHYLLGDVTIGASAPSLASSVKSGRLYVNDILSNTVHVIDRDSGLRKGQFPIASLDNHSYMGFGSIGLSSLGRDGIDLLVLPLIDFDPLERDGRSKYRGLAYGRIDKDLPACGLADRGLELDDSLSERFDELTLTTWDLDDRQDVPMLVLNRLHDQVDLVDEDGQPAGELPYPARTWCRELDFSGQTYPLVKADQPALCDLGEDDLSGRITMVRVARDRPAIARLTSGSDDQGSPALELHLTTLARNAQESSQDYSLSLEPELEPFVTDMLVAPTLPGAEEGINVFLPFASLGRIGLATFPENGPPSFSQIDTGGEPIELSISPDGRRLYVTHVLASRLDIIRLDCGDQSCAGEIHTLDVAPWPYKVSFDETGRRAYLLHLFSHDITVME